MNRDAILFHLGEAKEELDRTISEIEQDPDSRTAFTFHHD
jgi:hypothetical protein